ncbi:MAG: bifunctional biotin--[acetyl-CoA-carboxylase] ligase/biotin operon repressor BirA [Gammaproteobacteria bacterium]|nr:bifunctional biotin--[acetyl-CoA-carboxylase] ligase/biotin operon repressor BirA [Gammaproteobacteria bacterium]MCI0590101.1 bifunctional biotin--[acetyl-CoA-carboxylase] ligase/biotin operon repressor BirA [Gammaproteobacteria bacterium]
MHQRWHLLYLLADGDFHSGQGLAAELGVSRTAVWKRVRMLEPYGLDVHAVPGKGYRLGSPIELLDQDRILLELDSSAKALLTRFDIYFETDSTNQRLLDHHAQAHGNVCLAEFQTAGRGRRGSRWVSPLGAGLCLSIGWCFDSFPDSLTGLALAGSLAVVRTLRAFGIRDVGLKWPNDVMWRGRKLAGILLEMRGESTGPCHVVAGVGINVAFPITRRPKIEQAWVDMVSILGRPISRNTLAARLIGELFAVLSAYQVQGFAGVRDEWAEYDLISGRSVTLTLPDKQVYGRVIGVDPHAALMLSVNGRVQIFTSGEVSLRLRS